MTTIAFDGISLCTDSLVTCNDIVTRRRNKTILLDDGRLFAGCGDTGKIYAVVNWLNGDDKPDADDDFQGVLIDGFDAFIIDNNLHIYPIGAPYATGSGQAIAMTAMVCGKSAREAVEIACGLDIYSGLPVNEIRISNE